MCFAALRRHKARSAEENFLRMDRGVYADGEAVELLQGFETPEAAERERVPSSTTRILVDVSSFFRVHAVLD